MSSLFCAYVNRLAYPNFDPPSSATVVLANELYGAVLRDLNDAPTARSEAPDDLVAAFHRGVGRLDTGRAREVFSTELREIERLLWGVHDPEERPGFARILDYADVVPTRVDEVVGLSLIHI